MYKDCDTGCQEAKSGNSKGTEGDLRCDWKMKNKAPVSGYPRSRTGSFDDVKNAASDGLEGRIDAV